MSLNTIEILLGVESDTRVATLYERYSALLLTRLQKSDPDILDVPEELEYVVDELTIARFNRLGSEGMTSESMDGHTARYDDVGLVSYENVIIQYLDSNSKFGRVRFI